MRLIYNMKYPVIDQNMSDCQMGGRKMKSCKNNIFIANGLIHEALKSKKMKPICLQIYDYAQMFDAIDLKQALSDLYDVGVVDDTLKLLYEANKEIKMAVKTPSGLTERQVVRDCVLQGDTWGSILASVQVDSIGKECVAAGHTYLYKDRLPVGFLGLVDDILGVTEAGMKAQQMNAFINLKTAEKTLQFGPTKCKTMLIGKDLKNVIYSDLMVDKWTIKYQENIQTGEAELNEYHCGLTEIGKVTEQKYLGFVLSSTGSNMANISEVKKKAIGVVKSALNKLNSMNLKNYYFECSVIILNVMVRSSILYASEMYYDLRENEIRQLERIEEEYLRKVLNTSKGCPIVQLYLAVGHHPARFEVQKMRLLYLKYVLQENNDSLINKFLKLQLEVPTKGDWASSCMQDLKDLEILHTLEEIRVMSYNKFKNIVKTKVRDSAYNYLISKSRSKGKENQFEELSMAEYLLPLNKSLSISEKQRLFAVKNRMVNIPANFPKPNTEYKCQCDKKEDMEHIFDCEIFSNGTKNILKYEQIYKGTLNEQIEVFRIFENNMERREKMKCEINFPCDPPCDPLFAVMG
jgi:hypothetical protein